ncbi:putative 3-hydroxyisobutyrate dehydrogenase, mitochondrial [Erysiphe neolycopersici]|uniref:3-hydroxyisobutyrate dehydrogenase n=1 Tax=Erysiphe neolycopersici TaxID=212602 RepID=A0A420HUY1_9PEZI|nr:putative 3-hydroxyisobutyrate dehydrogenase, mitochondrial [Erysiphe neolycopersici]
MAKNLQSNLSTSETLNIFDINCDSVMRLVNETKDSKTGASVKQASSAFDAAKNSQVIVTVLPDSSQVKEVYRQIFSISSQNYNKDKNTKTEGNKNRNQLFIDCSTIDPMTSKEIARMAYESKEEGTSDYVDAPMSGGVTAAKQSSLTFMLGCPDNLVSKITPILQKLGGKQVIYCGPQSLGLAGKLANNYLLAINNIATAEAMRLGMKWGIDATTLSQLINQSTGRCWPSAVNNPVKGVSPHAPANRDYMGGFSLGLMKKDLILAILSAKEVGLQLELAERARELYEDADTGDDYKRRDFSIIYKYLEMKDSEL